MQLPGLMMDKNFSKLIPCVAGMDLEKIKEKRKKQLFDFFVRFQPDVFLVELYPFGRKAFRFELDPVLDAISSAQLGPCVRLCSLRDILVEKKDKKKYETRVLEKLNSSFDGLLIHSDPAFIALDATFAATDAIPIPTEYTGFITPEHDSASPGSKLRLRLGLSPDDKLIVASIGGGNVGAELLLAVAEAAERFKEEQQIHFHLFTGPYSAPALQTELGERKNPQLHIHDFSTTFPQWLQAADLSISMAGYNTCMNLLQANIPALLYPFAQNREQRLRIAAFAGCCNFSLLEPQHLAAETLAATISTALKHSRKKHSVNLQGAANSCQLINNLNIWKRTQP